MAAPTVAPISVALEDFTASGRVATPALLTAGLVRSEAQARTSAVRIEGDRRNA